MINSTTPVYLLSDAELVANIRERVNHTKRSDAIYNEAKNRGLQGCDGCSGDGIYYGRGYVENGVFKGFQGMCFRCEGKGFQNPADKRRNWGYDQNRRYSLA